VMCRAIAMSFRPFQNASSRLTLVLWPAITIERLTTGDFIAASGFNTVLVEAIADLVAPGLLQVLFGPGNSVGQPICRSFPLGPAPFCPFSLGSEVNDGHSLRLDGIQVAEGVV
jgi:hypothetical protein